MSLQLTPVLLMPALHRLVKTCAVLSQGWYPSAHSTINNSGPGVDNNPMTLGQCTWFAWYWRAANGNPLPGGGTLGHARTLGFCSGGLWLPGRPYSRSWRRLPDYCWMVWSRWYCYECVNADGSIVVREMNLDSRGIGTLTEGYYPGQLRR